MALCDLTNICCSVAFTSCVVVWTATPTKVKTEPDHDFFEDGFPFPGVFSGIILLKAIHQITDFEMSSKNGKIWRFVLHVHGHG